MDSSNLIKIIAAFVAGIVIALGGTLIYVRTNQMVHPQLVAQTSPPVRDASETQDSELCHRPGCVRPGDPDARQFRLTIKFRHSSRFRSIHPKKRVAVAKPDPEPAPPDQRLLRTLLQLRPVNDARRHGSQLSAAR